MTNKHTLDLARQWAADIDADRQVLAQDTIDAAADLISSLPDEWVSADELRDILDGIQNGTYEVNEGRGVVGIKDDLEALLPAPPTPRTLADMTAEERAECQWMQADHVEHGRVIITHVGDEYVHYLKLGGRSGVTTPTWEELITPLPDLPRMEWPASEPSTEDTPGLEQARTEDVEPAPEPAAPRPEDVPVGEPWQVEVDGRVAIGYRHDPTARLSWTIVYRDDYSHDWAYDSEVTLIARLVPETTEQDDTEQDDVPEFDPAYTYRDKDGDTWGYIEGRWVNGDTHNERVSRRGYGFGIDRMPEDYGPYTRIEDAK